MVGFRERVVQLTMNTRDTLKSVSTRAVDKGNIVRKDGTTWVREKFRSTTSTKSESKSELVTELNESLRWEYECGKQQGEKSHGTFTTDSRPSYFYSEVDGVKVLFAPIEDVNIHATHQKKTNTYELNRITAEVTAPQDELVVELKGWKVLGTYFAAQELNELIDGRIPIRFNNNVPEFDSLIVNRINRELVNVKTVHKPINPNKKQNIVSDK